MAGSKRAPAKAADPEPSVDEAPAGESPVVALISKRLRNLRKKLKNVEALEAMQRESKELDSLQARSFRCFRHARALLPHREAVSPSTALR